MMRTICLALAVAAAAPSAYAAEEAPSYPSSVARGPLVEWLRQETDIAPDHVVAVSSAALLAIMQVRGGGDGRHVSLTVRGEVLGPGLYTREHFLSWYMPVEIDCAEGAIRQGKSLGYGRRNLLGDARLVKQASAVWVKPPPGTGLDQVRLAACDDRFVWPLTDTSGAMAHALAGQRSSPEKAASQSPSRPSAPPPTPAPASDPRSVPHGRGQWSVQVGAARTEGGAQATIRSVAGSAAARSRIERAEVGGVTYFRALIDGFASLQDAQSYCRTLAASGAACFPKKAPASPPATLRQLTSD